MRSPILILAFLLVATQASLLRFTGNENHKTDGDGFWTRQLNILKLFNHYTIVNSDTEQFNIAKNYKLDTLTDKIENKDLVKYFLMKIHDRLFLKKDIVFSITNKMHRDDAILLVDIFQAFADFDSFYNFACWARQYINNDMFLYTFSIALLTRKDCQDFILPAMYEVEPNKFFDNKILETAKIIKMQGNIFDVKTAAHRGTKKIGEDTFVMTSNFTCSLDEDMDECRMKYFTEDVGLNNRYYILNAMNPFWMKSTTNTRDMKRRGEFFLFIHQQLLNRYALERLSNNMGRIPDFSYDTPIIPGMHSNLVHQNGLVMPQRDTHFVLKTVDNDRYLTRVMDYERRLRDAIDKGIITTDDGKTLTLKKPEDIELLGALIQSNGDCPNNNYYMNGLMFAKRMLGNGVNRPDSGIINPAILEQYETALRDPMFYRLWKRIFRYVELFKQKLEPYTMDEVKFDGVTINEVKTDRLETFFDKCDSDISNAVFRDEEELVRNRDKFRFIARQSCLSHRKFNVEIDYTSDKETNAIVKIFLGPKTDIKGYTRGFGRRFLQLDSYFTTLTAGTNKIIRESENFCKRSRDVMTFTKLMKKVEGCTLGECELNNFDFKLGFPNRMMLPRGKTEGMMFKLFVSITPVKETKVFQHFDKTDEHNKDFFYDDNALGYPLDREIDYTVFTKCTNMKMIDVMIFNGDKTSPLYHKTTNYNNRNEFYNIDNQRRLFFDEMDRERMLNRNLDMMNKDTLKTNKDKDVIINRTGKDITVDTPFFKKTIPTHDINKNINTMKENGDFTINKNNKDVKITRTGSDIMIDTPFMKKKFTQDTDKDKKDGTNFDKDFTITRDDIKITKNDKDITIDTPLFKRTFTHDKVTNFDKKTEETKDYTDDYHI